MITFARRQSGLLCLYFSGAGRNQRHWHYRSASGECSTGVEDAPCPALEGDQVWLAVPSERCLFYTASGGGGRISPQALRWQLEGFALGDIEALHITVLAKEAGQQHLVAIDAEWLRTTLAHIAQSGLRVSYALPDVMCLPQGHASQAGEQWLAHHAPFAGVSLPSGDVAHLQTLDPTLAGLPQVAWPALPAKPPCFSLLHDAFSPAIRWGKSLHCLAAALLLSLAALPAVPLWQGWQLNRAAGQINQQALQRYQHYFNGQSPTDAGAAFRHQLQRLEAAPSTSGLLSLMTASQALLANLDTTALQRLEWDAARQQLHLHFATPLAATALQAAPAGIRVDLQDHNQLIIGREP